MRATILAVSPSSASLAAAAEAAGFEADVCCAIALVILCTAVCGWCCCCCPLAGCWDPAPVRFRGSRCVVCALPMPSCLQRGKGGNHGSEASIGRPDVQLTARACASQSAATPKKSRGVGRMKCLMKRRRKAASRW